MEPDIDKVISKIQHLIDLDKYEYALKYAFEELQYHIDDEDLLIEIARIYISTGEIQKSIEFIKRAVEQNPQNDYYYYVWSIALLNNLELLEAEKKIIQAIRLESESALYFNTLARIKLYERKFKTALKYVNKALSLEPDLEEALDLKSEILLRQNKPKTSEKYIVETLKVNPLNIDANQRRAKILIRQNKFNEAREILESALRINPNNDYGRYLLSFAIRHQFLLKYRIFYHNRKILNVILFIAIIFAMSKHEPASFNLLLPIVFSQFFLLNSDYVIDNLCSFSNRVYPSLLDDKYFKKCNVFFLGEGLAISILLLDYILKIAFLPVILTFLISVPFCYFHFIKKLRSILGLGSLMVFLGGAVSVYTSIIENSAESGICILYCLFTMLYLVYVRNFADIE